MKIAVCTQNGSTITAHPGKCRNFTVYNYAEEQLTGPYLIQLPVSDVLQRWPGDKEHPLAGISILITQVIGDQLLKKLSGKAISVFAHPDLSDPLTAVQDYLAQAAAGLNQPNAIKQGKGLCQNTLNQEH